MIAYLYHADGSEVRDYHRDWKGSYTTHASMVLGSSTPLAEGAVIEVRSAVSDTYRQYRAEVVDGNRALLVHVPKPMGVY